MRHPFREQMIILFVAGVLALNYPFVSIVDRLLLPLGIPLLYLYLFLIWVVIIVLMALIAEKSCSQDDKKMEP